MRAQALRQAIARPDVTQVTVISRSKPYIDSPKLRWIRHSDFDSWPSSVLQQLEGHTGCVWALGCSSVGIKEADYRIITHEYTLAAAKAFATLSPPFHFAFLSGGGAAWNGAKTLYGRVKVRLLSLRGDFQSSRARQGETERDLAQMADGPNVTSFRPGAIQQITPKPNASFFNKERFLVGPSAPLLYRFFPHLIIPATDLGAVMVDVALRGPGEGKGGKEESGVYENEEIRAHAARLRGAAE